MSDGQSSGSFDDDNTICGFVGDLQHFCGVARGLVKARPECAEGPWRASEMTAADLDAMWARLEVLAVEEAQNTAAMTLDYTGELLDLHRRVVPAFHTVVLNWHCVEFYPFHTKFTPTYEAFVTAFLQSCSQDHFESFTLQEEREYTLSAYTYSHRVKPKAPEVINHSRISFGSSYLAPEPLVAAAEAVLNEHNVVLPDPFTDIRGKFKFYGLGWDYDAGHMKIYLHGEAADLPAQYRKSVSDLEGQFECSFMTHVLIAYTANIADGAVLEDKLYMYAESPADVKNVEFPSGTLNTACVCSAGDLSRGVFWQYDVTHTPKPEMSCEKWRTRLNASGQKVFDAYEAAGMRLDTLGWLGEDNFTLYFPFEP
eukprot:TRINITY_DN6906_c0_g1_i1.p1 TRINITY_DN6906_c0_g1~~TRINITY_DN6906_c0_g1_i1.p1  ORF type:complete len:369 (+),score=133.97 TRINITY_DN6906_c0_g1_i1:68-1174(+)